MPVGYKPLGQDLYLFSKNNGHPSMNNCTIVAHGEQKLFARGFIVPQRRAVHFYTRQGSALVGDKNIGQPNALDSAFMEITTGRAHTVERVGGGERCQNYYLTKFQHGYAAIENFISKKECTVSDIVTIRNRGINDGITLHDLIAQLLAQYPQYTEIRCCFCRSAQLPFIQQSAPNSYVLPKSLQERSADLENLVKQFEW